MTETRKSTRRVNMARCRKCGETLVSQSRHDYNSCSCGNLAVDGGTVYQRRVFGEAGFDELSTGFEPSAGQP